MPSSPQPVLPHRALGRATQYQGPLGNAYTVLHLREKETFSVSGAPAIINESQPGGGGDSPGPIADQFVTKDEDQSGYDHTASGGTTTPTTPTALARAQFQNIIIVWNRQLSLTNFDHYEVQVSDDQVNWYSLKFDGTDWKDTLGGLTTVYDEEVEHTDIPLAGTVDDPQNRTLYYRVRRVTKAAAQSGWSTVVSATASPVVVGDIAQGSVTTAKLLDGSVTTAKIGDSQVTTQKIGDSAVTTLQIGDFAVTTDKLGTDAVTAAKMEILGGAVVDELYVRGTGYNNSVNRVVRVGGSTLVNAAARGLTLTVLKRVDHSELAYRRDGTPTGTLAKSQNYDIYGSDTARLELRDALVELRTNGNATRSAGEWGEDIVVTLTSFDSWLTPAGNGYLLVDEMLLHGATEAARELLAEIVKGNTEVYFLDQELEKLPAKIPFDQAHGGKMLLKLNFEKKRFLDCIKLFSCNIQEQMCKILLNYYDKPKELMPALAMILNRGGYLKLEHGKLKVSLRRFRNNEIDYAARRLCEDLNAMAPKTLDRFQLPMIYEVL